MNLCAMLLMVVASADKVEKPAPAPALVTVTGELACLHCTFGEGDSCAVCLKLDAKTPVILLGKPADAFFKTRFSEKVLVVQGTLALNKEKRLVLTCTEAHEYTAKDKETAPAKGQARIEGKPCCGHCDVGVGEGCSLAIVNAAAPVVLDGKLAAEKAEAGQEAAKVIVFGTPSVDKKGTLRLDAIKVLVEKKK